MMTNSSSTFSVNKNSESNGANSVASSSKFSRPIHFEKESSCLSSRASLNLHNEDFTANNDIVPIYPWYKFEGVGLAQGFNLSGIGRGALIMSNIFLATAFVYLAQKEAGCIDEDDEEIEDCDGDAFGFKPASFVSNIAVISSVLSALFMPLIGAMIDCTEHRKSLGVFVSVVIVAIQLIQIAISSKTWLAMAVLQALSGFLYQVLVLAVYSYLPDMSYRIDEGTMTKFTSIFQMNQFASQAAFLLIITALSLILDLGDVVAAQMSQGINAVWSGVAFFLSWQLMEKVPPRRQLPEGKSLLGQGFSQIFSTAADINKNFKKGTRWFFLSLIFVEAGVNAFTTVAVVFLDEQLGLSFTDIGIFFFISLVASIPGSLIGASVTRKLDPRRSWQLSMVCLFVWAAGGAVVLDFLPSSMLSLMGFVWGAGVGVLLGWYYPVENLYFSMCLPKGQESEFSGFFVYCTQILGWLPPLIFSFLVEADVSQTYGVVAVSSFLLLAAGIQCCASPWQEILIDSGRSALPEIEVTESGDIIIATDSIQTKSEEDKDGDDEELVNSA